MARFTFFAEHPGDAEGRAFLNAALPDELMRSFLLWLALVFCPLAAMAQPLSHYEHDWTFTIGGQMYGLREVVQTPGEFRRTQLWVGGYSREVRLRPVEVVALALVPLAAAVFGLWHVSRRTCQNDDSAKPTRADRPRHAS